ncbi:MAG TPA: hypothetical protein ACN46V_08495 [Prochlorococcus sp.]|tara:strand:+ start:2901 stop:3194 length:294 start_codon:yes stop_codon:yes gene_type:complete
MSQHREPATGSLTSLISGAVLGAAGLAWWLISEAERRQRSRQQRAMLYSPRMQDGSEALEAISDPQDKGQHLERRVEQLNAAIADVRRQLEDLGAQS